MVSDYFSLLFLDICIVRRQSSKRESAVKAMMKGFEEMDEEDDSDVDANYMADDKADVDDRDSSDDDVEDDDVEDDVDDGDRARSEEDEDDVTCKSNGNKGNKTMQSIHKYLYWYNLDYAFYMMLLYHIMS